MVSNHFHAKVVTQCRGADLPRLDTVPQLSLLSCHFRGSAQDHRGCYYSGGGGGHGSVWPVGPRRGLCRACWGWRRKSPIVGALKAEQTTSKQEISLLFILFYGWAPPFLMWMARMISALVHGICDAGSKRRGWAVASLTCLVFCSFI